MISFIQHTLAFITSLFLYRMFAQSRTFYEYNMILSSYYQIQPKVVLKVVHGLMDTITRTKTHKKHYHYKKISPLFFSVVYNKNPCDSTIYRLLFLPSWTTSWIFYNAETQQHHASQIRRIPLLLKTTRKKVINCDSDFKWDFALKWRPSWTQS